MAVRCLASHQMSTPLGTGPAAGSTSADQHPLVLVFHQHETSAHPPHTPATHWMSCGQDIFVMQSSTSDQAQWLRILPPHPHLGCPPFLRARRVILWWTREFIFSDCGGSSSSVSASEPPSSMRRALPRLQLRDHHFLRSRTADAVRNAICNVGGCIRGSAALAEAPVTTVSAIPERRASHPSTHPWTG